MKLAIQKNVEFGNRMVDVRAEFLYPFLLSSFFRRALYIPSKYVFFVPIVVTLRLEKWKMHYSVLIHAWNQGLVFAWIVNS
jgi:hypothetical protein